ncbi:MAG: tRNA-dihydrouridine synthase [Candidatus Colwellbacteria bacterium]|nr:tRNA-dihydrouridine synthase [Candidatus Colwellbacteria bacterium]
MLERMVSGFWEALPQPFFALAPMADVTDAAFRRIIAKYGKPDVMWTEFVSADGLASRGAEALVADLVFDESERPIVAQIFGSNPVTIERAASCVAELGFDGVDINMGCPDRNVEKQGAGAALIKNPKLAREVIAAAKRGAGDLPVSIKTRIGYDEDILDAWLPTLLEAEPAAVTVHARTRSEMSDVPARWEAVRRAVEMRNRLDRSPTRTLIVGNGDVKSVGEAFERARETGADGVMVGRGVFGNPWFFNRGAGDMSHAIEDRLRVLVEHTELFERLLGDRKNFSVMRKHFGAYIAGFDGAKELRTQLMSVRNARETREVVSTYVAARSQHSDILKNVGML